MDAVADFERERPRLHAVATRLLGSAAGADDAVQETWLRLQRTDLTPIGNLEGWLTTVVSRVCLDELKSARRRYERPWQVELWPEPAAPADDDPEDAALRSEQVGLALSLVLERLTPAERVGFVLVDVFGVGYAEIAEVLGKTQPATRKLVSRARTKVHEAGAASRPARSAQRLIVRAWLRAVEAGDLSAILALLSDDAVLTADWGDRLDRLDGAAAIASQAARSKKLAANSVLVRIDGEPGVAAIVNGRAVSLMAFTIVDERIDALTILIDGKRLERENVLAVVAPC